MNASRLNNEMEHKLIKLVIINEPLINSLSINVHYFRLTRPLFVLMRNTKQLLKQSTHSK